MPMNGDEICEIRKMTGVMQMYPFLKNLISLNLHVSLGFWNADSTHSLIGSQYSPVTVRYQHVPGLHWLVQHILRLSIPLNGDEICEIRKMTGVMQMYPFLTNLISLNLHVSSGFLNARLNTLTDRLTIFPFTVRYQHVPGFHW